MHITVYKSCRGVMEIMTHDYKIKVTSSAIVLLLDEATSGPSTPKVSGLIASYDRTVTVIAHYLSTIPTGEGRYHKE